MASTFRMLLLRNCRNFTLACAFFATAVAVLASSETVGTDQEEIEVPVARKEDEIRDEWQFRWGLPDATAIVGRLFQYRLPPVNGKQGEEKPASYKVHEVGQLELPTWLRWNSVRGLLEGVASAEQMDKLYYLQTSVQQLTADQTDIELTEYFSVKVLEDTGASGTTFSDGVVHARQAFVSEAGVEKVECPPGAAVTTTTVVVDAELNALTSADRVDLLRGLAGHLGLSAELLRLSHSGSKPILDASALVAGPGNTKESQHTGVLVAWDVGCGNVLAKYMPVLELLETTSVSGSMSAALGRDIVGWHITNNKPLTPKRLRRDAGYSFYHTPTEVFKPVPPTGRPVPTKTLTDTDMPPSRIIVSTASPVFPEATMTKSTPSYEFSIILPTRETTPVRPTKITKSPLPSTQSTHVIIAPTRTVDVMPTTTVVTPPRGTATPRPPTLTPHSTLTPSPDITTVATKSTTTTWSPDLIESSTDFDYEEVTMEPTAKLPPIATMMPPRTSRPPSTSSPAGTKPPPASATPDQPTRPPTRVTTPKGRITTKKPKTPKPPEEPTQPTNREPVVENPIGRLKATVGKLLWFQIPSDTFWDHEDGSTENINLLLMVLDEQDMEWTVSPNSWIKLNKTSQVIYGLPMEDDVGEHNFVLAAIDKGNKITKLGFEIVVHQRSPSSHRTNHEFSVTLDLDYDQFMQEVNTRLEVAKKIASAFGDKDSSHMTITGIKRGSVVFSWTNNSLPLDPCPEKQLAELLKRFLLPDGTINETFVNALKPVRIIKASAGPAGTCTGRFDPIGTGVIPSTTMGVEPEAKKEKPQDNFLWYIIIAVIVVGVLLLIIIIVCVCLACRRKQQKRRNLEEQDKLSGLHKGIPIIFADEMEDREESPPSTLRKHRLDDEESDDKQPVPPPDYQRSMPASRTSTLKSDYKAPLISSDDEDDDSYGKSRRSDEIRPNTERSNQPHDETDSDHRVVPPPRSGEPPATNSLPPYRPL